MLRITSFIFESFAKYGFASLQMIKIAIFQIAFFVTTVTAKSRDFDCSLNLLKGKFSFQGVVPCVDDFPVAYVAHYKSKSESKVLFAKGIEIENANSEILKYVETTLNSGFKLGEAFIITTKINNKTKRSLWHVNPESGEASYTFVRDKGERIQVSLPKEFFVRLIVPE